MQVKQHKAARSYSDFTTKSKLLSMSFEVSFARLIFLPFHRFWTTGTSIEDLWETDLQRPGLSTKSAQDAEMRKV